MKKQPKSFAAPEDFKLHLERTFLIATKGKKKRHSKQKTKAKRRKR